MTPNFLTRTTRLMQEPFTMIRKGTDLWRKNKVREGIKHYNFTHFRDL